jgi:hypothetical protein
MVGTQVTNNAPSSSTIATAVAAAVPTISAINSSVANNAPSPNAWTLVSSVTPNNTTNSYTFSSLSGYRTYRILASGALGGAGNQLSYRINGDSGSNYDVIALGQGGGSAVSMTYTYSQTGLWPLGSGSANAYFMSDATFEFCLSSGYKAIKFNTAMMNSSAGNYSSESLGIYRTTSAVSSITVFNSGSGYFASYGSIYLYGAN